MATLTDLSNVASTISAGNFASKLASTTAGTSSLATSLDGMSLPNTSSITSAANNLAGTNLTDISTKISAISPDVSNLNIKPPNLASASGLLDATKGVSGSAFSAISSSFKALKAGVPQNLTAIDLKNKTEQVAADTKAAASPSAKSFTDSLSTAGVDLKTGKIASVDAAVAAGGVGAGINALSSAMSGVPGMSGLANVNASTMASGLNNLPGGQSAVASLINSGTNATSGVSDTLSGLNTITKTASSSALNSISSATAGTSAASSLLAGGALTGVGTNLADKITNPAGLLPATPSIDSLTKGLQTGKQPLSALATTGLSTAGAAALAASMNSISTSSPNPIKMPTIATSTVDRGEISSQVKNLLGDKKIPPPNYNPTPPATSSVAADIKTKKLTYLTDLEEYNNEVEKRAAAIKAEAAAYQELKNTLPEGDPQVTTARDTGKKNAQEFSDWNKAQLAKLEAQRLEINQLQRQEGQAVWNQSIADARAKIQ